MNGFFGKKKKDDLVPFSTPAEAQSGKRKSSWTLNSSQSATGSSASLANSAGDDLLPFNTPSMVLKSRKSSELLSVTGGTPGHSRVSSNVDSRRSSYYVDPLVQPQHQPQPQPQAQPHQPQPSQQPQQNPQQPYNRSRPVSGVNSAKAKLLQIFQDCDTDHNDALTPEELVRALKNNDNTSFHLSTARQMVNYFDVSNSGAVGFDQFVQIWDYLYRWRQVFNKFDVDKSLSISYHEYVKALEALGFHLESGCLNNIFYKFSYQINETTFIMKLDSFVESMVWLMQITEEFKKFPSRDGGNTAEVPFSSFLDVLLRYRQ